MCRYIPGVRTDSREYVKKENKSTLQGDLMQNNESLKQVSESANWTTEGGGTAPSDKSQPTEKQQEATIMTGAAHEKCQNLSFLQAGQFAGRCTHSFRRHDTDLNLKNASGTRGWAAVNGINTRLFLIIKKLEVRYHENGIKSSP